LSAENKTYPLDGPRLRTIRRSQPHPDNGGWGNFLRRCEIADQHDGVVCYVAGNCNYIVMPNGLIFENYGWAYKRVMSNVRDPEIGWRPLVAATLRHATLVNRMIRLSKQALDAGDVATAVKAAGTAREWTRG
jgi:hypothetical protein